MGEKARRAQVLEMLEWISQDPRTALETMSQSEIDTCIKRGFLPAPIWADVSKRLLKKK